VAAINRIAATTVLFHLSPEELLLLYRNNL
jgi:hypothetical protein